MAEAADIPSSVLVVDDEPIVLQLFSRVLSEKGLRTRTASSAEEALKLLEQGGIACVLADKNMPGMDGIEMYLQKPFEDLDLVAQRIEDAIQQVRSDLERSATMARLGVFQQGEPPAPEDQSDPGAPIQMLEARVRQATEDLRARCLQLLSRLVASKGAGREVLLSGERILDEVRRARQASPSEDMTRIERLLEEHLALARHAQSR